MTTHERGWESMVCRELAHTWNQCGINKSSIVLIHSSLRRTLHRYSDQGMPISPRTVLESFVEAVGPQGTIVLPLFNFDFCTGAAFDIRTTPSRMGALTEAARTYPGAIRTAHPIYSVAVIGRLCSEFFGMDNQSGLGPGSPFEKLHVLDGSIAVLDLPELNSMTFYHYIEQMHQVDFRYHKYFSGYCTDEHGETRFKTYEFFVRDVEHGVVSLLDPVGELLWQQGFYSGFKPFDGPGLRVIKASVVYDFVSRIITQGRARGLLYDIVDMSSVHQPLVSHSNTTK